MAHPVVFGQQMSIVDMTSIALGVYIYGMAAAEFSQAEGLVSTLTDDEAAKWFVDDWGNNEQGLNVSFVRPLAIKKGRIAIIQTGMYDAWNWRPTLDAIVRPHVADVSPLRLCSIFDHTNAPLNTFRAGKSITLATSSVAQQNASIVKVEGILCYPCFASLSFRFEGMDSGETSSGMFQFRNL